MALISYLVPAFAAAMLVSALPAPLDAAPDGRPQSNPVAEVPVHKVKTLTIQKGPRLQVHKTSEERVNVRAQPVTTIAGLKAVSQQTPCGRRAAIVQRLSQAYSEKQQSVGRVSPDAAVEVFVAPTGAWTIIATGTDGTSCLMAAGDGWDTANLSALPGS